MEVDDNEVKTEEVRRKRRYTTSLDKDVNTRQRKMKNTFSNYYITWKDLYEQWNHGISNLENAVRLKEKEGTILISNKSNIDNFTFTDDTIIHIDPRWILELLKPLL